MHTYNTYSSSCTNCNVLMYSVWNHYHIKIKKKIPSPQTALLDHSVVRTPTCTPRQLVVYFLSCSFVFLTNAVGGGILQYVAICVTLLALGIMLLRFIHAVAGIVCFLLSQIIRVCCMGTSGNGSSPGDAHFSFQILTLT